MYISRSLWSRIDKLQAVATFRTLSLSLSLSRARALSLCVCIYSVCVCVYLKGGDALESVNTAPQRAGHNHVTHVLLRLLLRQLQQLCETGHADVSQET